MCQIQSIPMPEDLHSNCYTQRSGRILLLCWGEAQNGFLGCNIRHCHYFTSSSALILTDSKVCHRTNEHFFSAPAQQCCVCWLVGSVEEQGKLSCLAGLVFVLPQGTPSTSDHPFRKAVWTPLTQDGGCQKKKKKAMNFSLWDRNRIYWVFSWFWTLQGLQFFSNCFSRGGEKSANLLGNLWTISINNFWGSLEPLID